MRSFKGTVIVQTPTSLIVIHRDQLRQVANQDVKVLVWFVGEENPYATSLDTDNDEVDLEASVFEDIVGKDEDIVWKMDERGRWFRNGAFVA